MLSKFWAPVPWMLEAAIFFQVALHEYIEGTVIAILLVFNAALGFFQQTRAQATLSALKSRLALTASVRRDGVWKNIPATELVPGDTLKLSLGGVVAADAKLVGGSILLEANKPSLHRRFREECPLNSRRRLRMSCGSVHVHGHRDHNCTHGSVGY
jgi:H+-transporting ATPase